MDNANNNQNQNEHLAHITHRDNDKKNNNDNNQNKHLEHMEMGIHRDSDKGWDEMLVWSPSVRKPQLDENNVGCVRKPQMNEDVKALLLS